MEADGSSKPGKNSERLKTPMEKFMMAIELFELACEMQKQNLRRKNPNWSEEEIEAGLTAWIQDRPCAPYGDAEGVPGTWPRT